ncbi:Efcab2 [Symbiodinium sp. KB8]|nr:Efcab2 [Symbiodinium sp. KB8]
MVHPGEVAAAELAKAKASIRDAFLLFGKEETMTIHDEDVATVLRFLGLYPTTADLVDKILPEMQGDTPGKYVAYEQFEERVLEYQSSGLFVPDTEETLLQAFRTLDPEDTGMVDADRVAELLQTFEEEPMTEKELDAFLAHARDGETNKIFYEDYVAFLKGQQALRKL